VTASVSRLDTLGGSTPLVDAAVVGTGVPRGNSQGTQGFAPITMESRLCRSNLQIGVGESIALSVTVTNTCPAGRHVFLAYDATSALSSIDLEPLTSDETLACQEKCASKKIKAGGRKAAAKVSCFAKAAARGEPPDLACLAKAEEKFGIAFARADAGSCFEIGDAPVIEAKTDSFVNDLVTELQTSAGPSKCTGSKLKAAGKKVGGRTGCFAKAAGNGVAVDPTCLQKYTNGFSAALQKAELKGDDCQTLGDATAIEAKIDSFSQDLVTELSTASSPSGAFLGEDGLFD
jgi:hypothetical protein